MPAAASRRITLLTDFGTADGYVAALKGVIGSIAPDAVIDDASHDIPAGDVQAAAWALAGYWNSYPEGAVHVVVIDPGVGGARRPLALVADGRFLVGPDNGVFTRILSEASDATVVVLQEDHVAGGDVSATFHGRDIFAPAAARLSLGLPLLRLGSEITDPVRFALPVATRDGAVVHGAVVHVDRFGSLITNIARDMVRHGAFVTVGRHTCTLRRTYSDAGPGELLAVVGSRRLVEVAVRNGSAAALLGAQRGAAVTVDGAAS
jgi:S-adenosyl-L-methionine hydrolase (adenosine-forming)